MMIPIQKNVLVNTDRISIVQLREVGKKIKVEVVVDNRSYIVDDDMLGGEFKNFLRGALPDMSKQYVSL